MVFTRATLLLGAALVLGSAPGASAADLGNYGGGGSLKDGFVAPAAPSQRSWYVRMDGGWSAYQGPDITENDVTGCAPCGATTTYSLENTDIDNTWSLGGGIGMHFTNRIRADLTYDHRFESDVTGSLPAGSDLPGVRSFGLKSDLFLANLYYDFDMGSRITPYVGGGIGFVRNKTSSGVVTDCGCTVATIDSGSNTDFAAALMAGVSVNLWGGQHQVMGGGMKDGPMYVDSGRKLALDIGYRYLFLGDAETGPVTLTSGGPVVSDDPIVESINAHEFRFGLRYDLN